MSTPRMITPLLSTLRCLAALMALTLSFTVSAADGQMQRIPTRTGVVVPTWWLKQDNAPATLVLLSGGAGTIGPLDASGWPKAGNFLIRSGKLFAARGYNLAMVAKPSDVEGLDPVFRIDARHIEDLHKVLVHLKEQSSAPIWLVSTSQSTISTVAMAIAERDSGLISGIVLTSSMTNFKTPGAVPKQALDQIKLPVLVMHHERDSCDSCRPYEVHWIMRGLKNAPVKKLIMVNGGENPTGDPCDAFHYHGYIGMEKEAVGIITDWIRQPAN